MTRYWWARSLLGTIPAFCLLHFYGVGAMALGASWVLLVAAVDSWEHA